MGGMEQVTADTKRTTDAKFVPLLREAGVLDDIAVVNDECESSITEEISCKFA